LKLANLCWVLALLPVFVVRVRALGDPVMPSLVKLSVPSSWDGSSANWSDASHWSTNPIFPNDDPILGTTYDATITSRSVTLDQNIALDALTLGGSSVIYSRS
jgi:hypothetical protein